MGVANILSTKNTSHYRNKELDFTCPRSTCNSTFSSKESLEKHEICHTALENDSEAKFICLRPECECSKTTNGFTDWRSCMLHLWEKHELDVGLLSCTICKNYKTTGQSKLDAHMLIHSEDRKFVCSLCKKRFKQLSQLRNHSISHMDKESEVIPIWYSKKKCELCGKFLSDSKCLKKHIQTVHSKLKP